MTIMVDPLDEVEAWTGGAGQPIPHGEHITEIDEIEEGVTSNQNPQAIITWRVVDGPHRDATSREWFVITPGAAGKVKALLEACEYTIPSGERFAFPTAALRGRRARTIWREDSYGGKTQIKCMGHSSVPAEAGGGVPIDTAGLPGTTESNDEPLPF